MKSMAKLIPWRPWMMEQHAHPMDTHSSWAFLANSAATDGPRPLGSDCPPHMAQPRANSQLFNPPSIPGSTGMAVSLHCHVTLSDRGQNCKARIRAHNGPLKDTHVPPWFGIKRATEEKLLELQPRSPLYFDVRYHQIQLLLIFSLSQPHAPWNKVFNIYSVLLLLLL